MRLVRDLIAVAGLWLAVVAASYASGYSSGGITVPVSVSNGGTGTTYGGAAFNTSDTISGGATVNLTATSAEVQNVTSGSNTITLPLASSCPGKTFILNITASSAIQTIARSGSDRISGVAGNISVADGGYSTSNPATVILRSNGVSQWVNPVRTGAGNNNGLAFFASMQLKSVAGSATNQIAVNGSGNIPSFSTVTASTAGITMPTVGQGILIKEGTNATMGVATLVAGTATVSTTKVTANSRIFLTSQADGGTPGFVRVSARNAGTDFTITSSDAGDTSTVAWEIVEPAP